MWVKIVPNISEGRNIYNIYQILKTFTTQQSFIIDVESDPSHNRSVITAVINLEQEQDFLIEFAEKCLHFINLQKHEGVHPRIGAIDVFPFVNFANIDEELITNYAKEFANTLHKRFGIPTYFYGKLAKNPQRKLSTLRKIGLDKLALEIKSNNPEYLPDIGEALHPTFGAICIGIREELIAYNIYLNSNNLNIAKKIAGIIRESNGGLSNVQALGFFIEHLNKVQVSMNLTNYKITSIRKVYDKVAELASAEGTEILFSEIIGLVPAAALQDTTAEYLKLSNFSHSQIFEYHLWKLGITTSN
jgi:glutamate formiminotransferase / 5-formyltetrahydrofolate cyclo-ligase